MKLCRLSVCFAYAPPVFLNVAVTFGSVTGLRRARAFFSNKRSKYLFVLILLTNAQSQSSHDVVVLLYVRLFQVIEQTSPVLDHHQQAAPRMIIFLVGLEMLSEFVDALT